MKQKRKRPLPMGKYMLRDALRAKLTPAELAEIERELRVAIEKAAMEAAARAAEEAYRRHWAVTMRVLRDRFGWGHTRIRRLWDASLDYLHDMDEGLISPQDILDTLEHDDGIRITWRVDE